MGNLIEHAQIMQTELDRASREQSTSGWMELNDKLVKYNGGAEVKIPDIETDGLGDYDRNTGFPTGSFSFKWKTYEMTQDRGQLFTFDEHETDETGFILSAPILMGEFQREHVDPEKDAYRYSKIAAGAMEKNFSSTGYTPTASNILEKLRYDIAAVQERVGTNTVLVITMGITTAAILSQSDKLKTVITQQDFQKGDISMKVASLDGQHPIIQVPSDRLKTAYEFYDGHSAGQESGGFKAADNAKSINWLITAKTAPIAVSKTDEVRIFDPKTYQKMRAWAADYRKFHDLWVPAKKWEGIHVNIKEV